MLPDNHPMQRADSVPAPPRPSRTWAERVFGHWWRRQSAARQDRYATLGPLLSVLLFLAAIVSAFWYLRNEEFDREQEAVRRDTEVAQQQVRLRLIENHEQLTRMARELVGRTLDLLLTTPLKICGEIDLRVHQNLLSRLKGIKQIRKIYSHAQSLAQCNGWLNQHLANAERVPLGSNAEAARRAAKEKGAAAIAGEAAAGLYKLKVLARGIEDDPNNTTRFLVLGQVDAAPSGRDRTSLVMSAENKPGAVHALLTPIAASGVSMSRIESRPARARSARWEYVFFIDLEGHQEDAKVAAAIVELRQRAPFFKVLGSYPIAVS